jgi:hypothetical protein
MSQTITDENGFNLFDYDPVSGRSIWVKLEGDERIFRIDQPVDKILDANAEHANNSIGEKFPEWTRVASIPLEHAYEKGLIEAGDQHDHKHIAKVLNDSDNRKFRTFRGNL